MVSDILHILNALTKLEEDITALTKFEEGSLDIHFLQEKKSFWKKPFKKLQKIYMEKKMIVTRPGLKRTPE